ncbi:hypothetical protein [Paracoccus luteus]|uniref:hypothetical protein n=1 Tax=Paracoccus luteus TaxID=2508543 RepID=UPI00106FAC73|nr:hypothetical protein [Paracoccus luteus]
MHRLVATSVAAVAALSTPAMAQSWWPWPPRPPVHRVPEIDLYNGVGAAMAVVALGLLLWDRRRRSVRS